MLRRLKIARETQQTQPESLFLERYERINGWALQLTSYDRDLAEDLVHDLYIQFVLNGPDPETIDNLDGYLYVTLRNLHIAQQRRVNRNRLIQLSVVEYDSAVLGLSAIDFRDQLAAQDDLRRVCQYACGRKESAKIASILILRFFHGYYPDEIMRVAGSPRSAVDKWLKLARGEAKASLEKDSKLSFITPTDVPEIEAADIAARPEGLLDDLREIIFRSRQGECFSTRELKELYPEGDLTPVECAQLAHLVSCALCLDAVNKLLGLVLLRERRATETLSRDRNKKDNDGGSGGGDGTGGGMTETGLALLRRKVKDTFVHKPQELCVAVNGYELGSHRVAAERSELNLVVERDDRIDFVEIYTEQKIRLLMHNIEEVPPSGPGERNAVVRLSDNRMLELSLRFTSPSPTIQVTYLDPTFHFDALDTEEILTVETQRRGDEGTAGSLSAPVALAGGASNSATRTNSDIHTSLLGLDGGEISAPKGFFETIRSLSFWLRPSTIAGLVSCLLLASVIYFSLSPSPVELATVPSVLKQATEAEASLAGRTDVIVHRTIDAEERNVTTGQVVRKRIDVWQSGERKAAAKRVFDQSGKLIAGEFTANGVNTVYKKKGVVVDANWQNALSAADFQKLIAAGSAQLSDVSDRYAINYERQEESGYGIIKASLMINKSDHRPVERTITIRRGGPNANDELIEYRFVETAFEQRAPNAVAPSVFEPDPELLVPDAAVVTKTLTPTSETVEDTNSNANTNAAPATTAIATADLEVEVLRLLNAAGADADDQTNVERRADGKLTVTGLVDTKERKVEILKALAPIKNNPAVVIRVETFAEAAARQKQGSGSQTSVEMVTVEKNRIAVYDEVARHVGNDEEAVRRFSAGVLNRSRSLMSQAGTLKKLAGRFSRDDLKNMTPEARGKWLTMVRTQARNCEGEARRLRSELSSVLYGNAGGSAGDVGLAIDSDQELQQAAVRLFAEVAANDRVIRTAFTISADGSAGNAVKNRSFLNELLGVERRAASLQRVK